MEQKKFTRLLLALVGVCLALTVAHGLYALAAYDAASITWFIGQEVW